MGGSMVEAKEKKKTVPSIPLPIFECSVPVKNNPGKKVM